MKKAFTLIELLVVMGILGVIVSVATVAMSGGSQSALNVKCETNIRNLAAACQTVAMSTGNYPFAGPAEKMERASATKKSQRVSYSYKEVPGWISGDTEGKYPFDNKGNKKGTTSPIGIAPVSAFCDDDNVRSHALTNGALWKVLAGNRAVYCCPLHSRSIKSKHVAPVWSYVMNEWFNCGYGDGGVPLSPMVEGRRKDEITRADRMLLFAEMSFNEDIVPPSESANESNDSILSHSKNEVIGFNHSSGKRSKFAIVVFADAHTERISLPKGVEENDPTIKELTKWLCNSKDVVYNASAKKFEELK